MARRRFQDPKPKREGNYWYLRVWQDVFVGGARTRRRQRIKIAPASTLEREAKKIAAEMLRPVNQGLVTVGSAVNFTEYVDATYIPTVLPLLAKTTQESYRVRIRKYLKPTFGTSCLRDLSPLTLQRYFSAMTSQGIAYPSVLKIRDTLSSILRSAVQYDFLVKNPLDGLRLPPDKRGNSATGWGRRKGGKVEILAMNPMHRENPVTLSSIERADPDNLVRGPEQISIPLCPLPNRDRVSTATFSNAPIPLPFEDLCWRRRACGIGRSA